jgi:hypothetical protein
VVQRSLLHWGFVVALGGPLATALCACGSDPRRPPEAPRVDLTRPGALIPSDVDLVLRLDVRHFRETMAPEPLQTLANIWQGFLLDASGHAPNRAWIIPTLAVTDTLWLGCRLGPLGCKDYVIVLRGNFSATHEKYGFGQNKNQRELGGGWVSYDGNTQERAEIARVYFKAPELAVLVSAAEMDSAELSVEQSVNGTELVPRESGLVSVLVRSHALADALRVRSPKAAKWLDSSEQVEIRIEPQATQTTLTFAVTFSDSPSAELAAKALKLLTSALSQFERRIRADDITVQQLNADVVLRVQLGK